MRFASIHACTVALLASAGLAGCVIQMAGDPSPEPPAAESPPAGGPSLRFAQEGTLTLAPGEARAVSVVASPAGGYRVRFALIGVALDASLDRAELEADARGEATVLLRASTQAATFRLRATILDGQGKPHASAETGVAVSEQGFGAVRVLPQYNGGRPVKGWTASLVASTTCKAIVASLPGELEGALVASTTKDEPVLVSGAPVGPSLAVAIRSGKYMKGCADTTELRPDTTLDVKVTVFDEPLDLSAADLDLSLAFTPDPATYEQILKGPAHLLGEAFVPSGALEATLLLDGMAGAADDTAFNEKRKAMGWDALAKQHMSGLGAPLRARVDGWAWAGLLLGAHEITANIQAKPGATGEATFAVTQLAGVDAAAAGVAPVGTFSLATDPGDVLILAGKVLWEPSRFIGASAFLAAKQEHPEAVAMADALASAAECHGLAESLTGYSGCDAACLEALCRAALDARWAAALGASIAAKEPGYLYVNATGRALINDDVVPVGLEGNWVGALSAGLSSLNVVGKMAGHAKDAAGKP